MHPGDMVGGGVDDGPFAAGGYYETRCKWCGGSQHARGADCPALERVAACTCTFEYPKCVCRGSQPDAEVKQP